MDGSFCRVPPVYVGRDKLVSYVSLFFHQLLVLLTALIVGDLEIHEEILVLQFLYYDGVGFRAVHIFSGLEGLDQGDVGGVVGNHDVLVTTPPCSGGEAACACVVRIDLGLVHCLYVEAIDVTVWW